MNERLRQARESLKLSVKFAARCLGILETDLAAIESGTRRPTSEEAEGISRLYGITMNNLCEIPTNPIMDHPDLCDTDRKQIAALVSFKHRYRRMK